MKCAFCSKECKHKKWLTKHHLKCQKLHEITLHYIHIETGLGAPLVPRCEFEDLIVKEVKQMDLAKFQVDFTYHFDEDGFSQYDKTHVFEGSLSFSTDSEESKIKLLHKEYGVAANYRYQPKTDVEGKERL